MNDLIECPICLNTLKNKFKITTPCNHQFCLDCFLTIYSINCPICRSDFKNNLNDKVLSILLKNSKKEKPKNNIINIHNHIEFPPLG